MKFKLLIISTLFNLTVLAQNYDQAAKIIHRLELVNTITESIAEQLIKRDGGNIQLKGYRICDKKVFTIDTLNSLLSNSEIDTLYNSDNGTLKFISFVLFVRNHNDKKSVLKKLNEVFEEKYILMISDNECNHAIHASSLGTFAYELITQQNLLFSPTFTLTLKEKKILQKHLEKYENGRRS